MRTLQARVGLAIMAVLVLGCEGDAHETRVAIDGSLPARADPVPEPAAADGATPARLVVDGAVVFGSGEPVGDWPVTLVDARGAPARTSTDPTTGRFAFVDVAAPYDLAVPDGEGPTLTVYQGLTRPDPRVDVGRRSAEPMLLQDVRVGVRCSVCTTASCALEVTTISPSGGGVAVGEIGPDLDECVVHVVHARRATGPENVDVTALVRSDDGTSYAIGRTSGVVDGGEPIDVGTVELAPTAVTAATSVEVGGGADLAGWRWRTDVSLALPDGASFALATGDEPQATVLAPELAGASVRASVEAIHPRTDHDGGFAWSAEAWSGDVVPGSQLVLGVGAGPEILRPSSAGTLSRHGPGFAWTPPPSGTLAVLVVTDMARATVPLRVYTAGSVVRFGRLAELDVPRLDPGDYAVELTTWRDAKTDDLVGADPRLRSRHEDRARPGARTSLRVPFQVTP